MKSRDRVLITIGDSQYMCAVVDSESNSSLILVSEDGEHVATIQQFWRKSQPDSNGAESIKKAEEKQIKLGVRGLELKCCEAPGCGNIYNAKRSDLDRGWAKTCSKSCAAKLREFNKK